MKTRVVNIDYEGIQGIQDLVDKNPDWQIITCGATKIQDYPHGSLEYEINFAVFATQNDEAIFDE